MRKKIVVIGSLNYDIILKQNRLPSEGETYAVESAMFCGGGKGANQAVQSAKLGADVYMVGAVGNDAMGHYLRESLVQYGVKTDYLKTTQTASGMGIVNSLEDGTVYANIIRGANYEITKEDIDHLDSILDDVKVMILQLEIPVSIVEYAIEKVHSKGIKVVLNAAPAIPVSENLFKNCDYVIVNEVESSYYCNIEINSVDTAKKEIVEFSEKYHVKSIFTLGKDGAVIYDGENVKYLPAHKVNAVETTGAGDSFVGALGYGIVEDMDLLDTAEFATCCSALTVCKVGAQPSMPTLKEVEDFRNSIDK
ncbi:MAG: ribokinase [Lachnospiraceae bacterium]|nr:ribokinase [Lachnospiraceae bacterium]